MPHAETIEKTKINILKMNDVRLFSYKMTHDTGFAPNPFHGILTLANCKPCIRKCKKDGDWIAGFSSKELNGDKTGKERLIYLMKVTDKISYNEYWNNPLYKLKKPNLSSSHTIDKAGDNIYKPTKINAEFNTDFEQVSNKNHNEKNKDHDLSGKYVLISECFYYFGSSPIEIDKEIRPTIPKGQSAHGVRTHEIEKTEKFIRYIQKNYQIGTVNTPHDWPDENIINKKYSRKCK